MHTMADRIILTLFVLITFFPSCLFAAAEQRTALVIGNSNYSNGPLKNPVNDAIDMEAALRKAGFSVTLKKNAHLREMIESIEEFGNNLKKGGVGLFYYAGHGVQVGGINYLLPIGARINKEGDVRYEAVDAGRILTEMETANNGLNIVILDACRDNPFGKSFRSSSRGLAIVTNAPTGTFISYSTGAGQVARDGTGRNSPYTAALLQLMKEPDLTIEEVFKGVRQQLRKGTGQVPWELSSLEGKFYFTKDRTTEGIKIAVVPSKSENERKPSIDIRDEKAKIEAEREKLQQERELFEQRKAIADERQKLDEERKQLSMAKPSSPPLAKEIRRDGRFIAYDNGTVLDTRTNLMWAAKDNGDDIKWGEAKKYCENYRGGFYTDWRLPTLDELAGLYDSSKIQPNEAIPRLGAPSNPLHLTELIDVTGCCPWASDTRSVKEFFINLFQVGTFVFSTGDRLWLPALADGPHRALPVRSVK